MRPGIILAVLDSCIIGFIRRIYKQIEKSDSSSKKFGSIERMRIAAAVGMTKARDVKEQCLIPAIEACEELRDLLKDIYTPELENSVNYRRMRYNIDYICRWKEKGAENEDEPHITGDLTYDEINSIFVSLKATAAQFKIDFPSVHKALCKKIGADVEKIAAKIADKGIKSLNKTREGLYDFGKGLDRRLYEYEDAYNKNTRNEMLAHNDAERSIREFKTAVSAKTTDKLEKAMDDIIMDNDKRLSKMETSKDDKRSFTYRNMIVAVKYLRDVRKPENVGKHDPEFVIMAFTRAIRCAEIYRQAHTGWHSLTRMGTTAGSDRIKNSIIIRDELRKIRFELQEQYAAMRRFSRVNKIDEQLEKIKERKEYIENGEADADRTVGNFVDNKVNFSNAF